jgi:tripartite-type tricarboxylate transporter receptor subunit TctC
MHPLSCTMTKISRLWPRRTFALACGSVLLAAGRGSLAQAFPSRVIKLISPSPPGGGTDAMARLVSTRLTEGAKWNVIVENLPGAGNNIGLRAGAKAPPDGHTLVMGETSNLAVNPYLFKKLDFNPLTEVVPVALIGSGPLVLVVRPGSRFDSVASVVEAARKGDVFYASSGNGTVGHLVAESLRVAAGLRLQHVPYKGGGPAMADLLGGQVDIYFASLTSALPHIAAGKLRALAVTSERRHDALPDVGTLAEKGYPALAYSVFYGVVAPAGTPEDVLASLNGQINSVLGTKEARAAIAQQGVVPQLVSRAQFAAFLTAERAKWAAVVKATGATVD